jgi:hypothetical protein
MTRVFLLASGSNWSAGFLASYIMYVRYANPPMKERYVTLHANLKNRNRFFGLGVADGVAAGAAAGASA